jgi:hypothetical protein
MKNFSEFLNEGTNFNFSSDQFPTISRSESARRLLPKLIDAINAVDGPVPNPVFKGMKFTFSAVLRYATRVPEEVLVVLRQNHQWPSWDYKVMAGNHIAGKLRKAEVAKQDTPQTQAYLPWFIKVCRELLVLHNALEQIKTGVFKRQPKAPEDVKAKYIAPMAKLESGRAVTKVFKLLTDTIKMEYAAAVAKLLVKQAEDIHAMQDGDEQRKQYQRTDAYRMDIWLVNPRNRKRSLVANYKSRIQKAAEAAADAMQEQFLVKNTRKLVSILEQKNVPLDGDPEILHARARAGVFEGDIRVSFADGSSFVVRNQVVIKRNSYGTIFNQFPTTFHNVTLPNGRPMGTPSEERMNTVFTKA